MKKSFKIENLDCAHCAAKMETAINKIDGVKNAIVSFMLARLTIEAEDERFDEIIDAADKAIKGVNLTTRIVR